VAPLLSGVDEVKRDVAGDEGHLSDRLHVVQCTTGNHGFAGNVAPMKSLLLVHAVLLVARR
jgi:hypothetical protein